VNFQGGPPAAKNATASIPIVFANAGDPVGQGFVQSLAHPGGNITGIAFDASPDITAKQAQLLIEAIPKASRLAALWNPASAFLHSYWSAIKTAAPMLCVNLQSLEVRDPNEFERAFDAMTREHADGLLVLSDTFTTFYRARLAELAAKHRLPTMYGHDQYTEAGGLMSYGPALSDAYIRLSAGANENNELAYRALWANAKSAGLLTGPYHNFTLIDVKRPVTALPELEFKSLLSKNLDHAREQAKLFKRRLIELLGYDPIAQQTVGTYGAPYLPAVLDISLRPQSGYSEADQARFGSIYREAVCEWIKEFQSDPQFGGQPVILFTKAYIYKDFDISSASCDLRRLKVWLSYHGRTGDIPSTEQLLPYRSAIDALCRSPDGVDRCVFQQYTSYGGFAVFRLDASLDLDRYFGTIEDLRAMEQRAKRAARSP
jgi:hypothetical protein